MHTAVVLILKTAVLLCVCNAQSLQELNRINVPAEDIEGIEEYTDLTIDQILTQSLGGLEVAAQKMLSPGGNILAELDMNLTEEQYHYLYSPPEYGAMEMMPYFENKKKRKKRKAVRRLDLRWPNGIVPYTFAYNHFSEKEMYSIKTAMREWEKYTCIKFRPANRHDSNYVRFQNGQGCNSQLGMVGGEQILNLDANGCRWKGLYLHEIGHAIGLVHEHQLPNRDDFITIVYQNVAPSMRVWFQKYTSNEVNQYDVNYQLSSVMHYGTTAFSADGRSTTIVPRNSSAVNTIGKVWRKELAFTDVKTVNRMYECAAHCTNQTTKCRDGGFLDQNCKCICPDGTDNCGASEALGGAGRPPDHDDCINMYDDWSCNVWAKQGECEVNPKFMKVSCKKACGICGPVPANKGNHLATFAWQWLGMFANIFPSDWEVDDCEDSYRNGKCDDWAANGDCVTNEEWMNENCKKACGLCEKDKKTTSADCIDAHGDEAECRKWAKKGECQYNKSWMTKHCKKTCKFCEPVVSDEPKVKPRQGYDDDDDDDGTDDRDSGSCFDKHNSRECMGWAKRGECGKNPKWMIPNCRKSCDKCPDGTCVNLYDDSQCVKWARNRECEKNPVWMTENCAQACDSCKTNTDDDGMVGRRGNDDRNNNNNNNHNNDDRKTNIPKDDPTTDNRGGCRNDHNDKDCNVWAKYGHCDINPSYMHLNCKLACGKCQGVREDSDDGNWDHQNDGTRDESRGGRTQTTTTPAPTTTTVAVPTCQDTHASCPSWVKGGLCSNNPVYGLRECKKSCENCNPRCLDKHTLCMIWAKGDQCNTNAGYMLRFCQKSCGNC